MNHRKGVYFILCILSILVAPVSGYSIGNGGSPWNGNSVMNNTALNDKNNVVVGILDANAEINYDLVFGWATDVQYSKKPDSSGAYFSSARERLNSFVNYMNTQDVSFIIETGDFINGNDSGNSSTNKIETLKELDTLENTYDNFAGPRYYVPGNHEFFWTGISDIKAHTGMNTAGNYGNKSFDAGNYHFVILDAQYDTNTEIHRDSEVSYGNGYIPQSQLDWLANDLKKTAKNTLIFVHQRIDTGDGIRDGSYFVNNNIQVRNILEQSGKVIGVFQGHDHYVRSYHYNINGIHYFDIYGMINTYNSNSYAKVYLKGKNIYVNGFYKADSHIVDDKWEEKDLINYNIGGWGLYELKSFSSPNSYRFIQESNSNMMVVNRTFSLQNNNFEINFKVLAEASNGGFEINLFDNNIKLINLGFKQNSGGGSSSYSDIYYKTSSGSPIFLQDYTPNQWYTFRLTDFNFLSHTYNIYIDGVLKGTNVAFSGAGSKINKLQLFGITNAPGTFYIDNIRIFTTTKGNIDTWYDAGSGKETYQIDLKVKTPANTNYTVWTRQNGTGEFIQMGGIKLGNTTTVLSPKYQKTDVRIVLNGNQTATPELISIIFYTQPQSGGSNRPNITSWGNDKTNNNSLSLTINVNEVVNFNATANQTITNWNWYQDGVHKNINYNNISISWNTPGIKNIKLNATNPNGTSNTVTWAVTVTVLTSPPSIVSWENNKINKKKHVINVKANEPVKINAAANQSINTWNWYVDNIDQNINYNNFTTSFASGTHAIKVNATNSNGTSNTITWTVRVNVRTHSPSIISWGNNRTNNKRHVLKVKANEPVKFNAVANQLINTWSWSVDNIDQNINYNNFTISFASETHKIKVNATNNNGTSKTITWTVSVNKKGHKTVAVFS